MNDGELSLVTTGSERFPFSVVASELGKRVAEGKKENKKHSKSPPLELCLQTALWHHSSALN